MSDAVITVTGVQTLDPPETRPLVYLDIEHNGTVYKWAIFVPPTETNLGDYLERIGDSLVADIDAKELAWQNLTTKTRTVANPMGEDITVDIPKNEIVRPDIPDNYARRRSTYPPLVDQIGALWKGTGSKDFQEMQGKILEIKEQYPTMQSAVPLEDRKTSLKKKLALTRWIKETSGTELNGMMVATDATSQTKILAAYVLAQSIPGFTVNWKMQDGVFYTLDKNAIGAIVAEVRTFVQSVFDWESALVASIDAATAVEDLTPLENIIDTEYLQALNKLSV
jgi:hypothetical protein